MNANQQKCTRRDEMRLILPRHVDFVNLDRIRGIKCILYFTISVQLLGYIVLLSYLPFVFEIILHESSTRK